MTAPRQRLPYDPSKLDRELTPFYISATEDEISSMLKDVGVNELKDLFSHLDSKILFNEAPNIGPHLEYDDLIVHMEELAAKNNVKTSFLGDGLPQYKVHDIVPYVCNIRGLTTAYTPYQPERSQGTLQTLWLYASGLSMLTGFEAINASFYDRATCLFEALNTSTRLARGKNTVLVANNIYPGDKEVLDTLVKETKLKIKYIPVNSKTGTTDIDALKNLISENQADLAGIAFTQVNNLGLLEDVHALTDLASENNLKSIAIIDPMLLANEGLLPPSEFGSNKQGTDMIVGEGQHLAIGPNYGGPGLGIFGIRFNEKNKTAIRSTAGRFVGKAKDASGKECLCMVLSTREQHIRREKATSNICSNQSFVATAAGAAILGRGEVGMTNAIQTARQNCLTTVKELITLKGVNLAYDTPFFNEVALELDTDIDQLIAKANQAGLQIGVNTSNRSEGKNTLLISFFDIHTADDLSKLITFFKDNFQTEDSSASELSIDKSLLRSSPVGLPNFDLERLKDYYDSLGKQNVSPDDAIYPLGSCTMKYNPYINDYAASLKGFTDIHPQAPESDAQGCLEILYHTQEIFKSICGLPGCVTQPVAGAQGELVGIKMFQAYHASKGNKETKNIILIPKTAHGTNPATATMAGLETKVIDGVKYGIVLVDADEQGQINFPQLTELVKEYGERICGIMVTNPNTSGVFENKFKEMSDLIHSVDGLVYMDGANMNAIASWVDLGAMGVDAVHNNLHKTWTIPHGGGGPGDAIVGVSEKLINFMPGIQVQKNSDGSFSSFKPSKTIGSFHRHHGNFAHKVRAYTYLKALGTQGVKKMAAVAVLSAQYLYKNLKTTYPSLPAGADNVVRMHEFILTLSPESFERIAQGGTPKAQAIAKIGKLYLDFGLHAPTVAFPEQFGLMIEPTESFTKGELDRFIDVVKTIHQLIHDSPEILQTVPHFTPVNKVDEVYANKNLVLSENITELAEVLPNVIAPGKLGTMNLGDVCKEIMSAHKKSLQ